MKGFYQSITVYGQVIAVDPPTKTFVIKCRSGDELAIQVCPTAFFDVLRNLDNLSTDRVPEPDGPRPEGELEQKIQKYIREKDHLVVMGVQVENEGNTLIEAKEIWLMHAQPGRYAFEETHWWINQIALMTDQWLDDLFDSRRSYQVEDFGKFYRTNLNINGMPTNDTIQECATLSRLIYGLSAAYLLTGSERYLLAAKSGVAYQREAFRTLTHDGEKCLWAYGRQQCVDGSKLVVPSQFADDRDTIPLYEQIYAIDGLSLYYRITQDWEVLEDIRRTINAFLTFYHDGPDNQDKGYPGLGGFFSHLDYITMRPDVLALKGNRSRKNWNSVGDHIPAYLVNLLLALDPLPKIHEGHKFADMREKCRKILDETSSLIVEKFPEDGCNYVNERFLVDFTPDHGWGWQQNRAIVGHNLKIAWNLTRVAFYYDRQARLEVGERQKKAAAQAKRCKDVARSIGSKMAEYGLDMIRGGCFDAVERKPTQGFPIQFSWGSTKEFWQQEQGILAYLILHGADPANHTWLELARECQMFWTRFFLDRDRQGIFFRTTESGSPVISGSYSQKSGHATGYHEFELNYLAHLYSRAFLTFDGYGSNEFCLYFKIAENCVQESVNVMPDFFPPDLLRIKTVRVNGVEREDLRPNSPDDFQIPLHDLKSGIETEVSVTFERQ